MKNYTKKQKQIINELHNLDYFYTRYSRVKEKIQKQFKINEKYINSLINREYEKIKLDNKDSLIYQKWFS